MNAPEFYVYAITFDQDTFGIYSTREAAEASLAAQIEGHGPAWEDCEVERWTIQGRPEMAGTPQEEWSDALELAHQWKGYWEDDPPSI